MSVKYLTINGVTRIVSGAVGLAETIEPKTYDLSFNPMSGEVLMQEHKDLTVSSKIYKLDEMTEKANRIIRTYESRERSTGILFSGRKGAGKTLLTKVVAQEFNKQLNASVFLVQKAIPPEALTEFLNTITDPVVVVFDEFEKMYKNNDDNEDNRFTQESMLQLFDGLFSEKKMFLLTCNEISLIDTFLRDRPGRLFYNVHYEGLDREYIDMYCRDVLTDKDNLEKNILDIKRLFNIASKAMTFDIISAIVLEMNLHKCSLAEALEWVNFNPANNCERVYYTGNVEVINPDLKGTLTRKEVDLTFYTGHIANGGTVDYTISLNYPNGEINSITGRPELDYEYYEIELPTSAPLTMADEEGNILFEDENFRIFFKKGKEATVTKIFNEAITDEKLAQLEAMSV